MGLLSALSTAVSGLNVNQQNLNVLSQNISNANTPNYSTEKVNQSPAFLAGQGEGVTVDSISRTVNEFLNSEMRNQTSANSANSTVTSYYSQIQNLLGQPGSTSTLDQSLSAFFVAAQDLANTPGAAAQTNVVNSASTVASQLSTLAGSLQDLRLQSESDIGSAVSSVNSDLQSLSKINLALQHATATNQNTSGLLDQRDAAINDIAQYIDIKPAFQPDGSTVINTTNGVTLLTGTTSSTLNFTPSTSTQTFVDNDSLSAINVTTLDANGNALGQPVPLATGGPSASVTTSLTGGKIAGLLQVRDTIIPNILGQLDQLSSTLRDTVNQISNAGTSYPPPNSYTGTTLVSGSSTSQYSGSIMVAALGANGTPVSSPYPDEPNGLQPLTLDLSSLNTGQGAGVNSVDGIIKTINQYYGAPQNKAEIGNINNVQLGVVSANVPDTGSTVNLDFNLNNISSSNADFYVGGVTVLDSSGNTVASSSSGSVTTTQPSFALAATGTYGTTMGNDTVTVATTGTSGLKDGDIVYLNAPSAAVNGIPAASLGGYFTVSNVSGSSFDITVSGASSAVNTTGTANAAGVTGLTRYATVDSGDTSSTQANGIITASLAANISSPYYTVQANIATVDSSGKIVTSTVSYRLANNQTSSEGNLIGATSANGSGTIVQPQTTQPIIQASLVDANGNPLPKINGSYGSQQGYLKITAVNAANAVAIDEQDSKQLGTPNGSGTLTGGTNQGFSQYFGLNNFFNANPYATSTDTVTNSALGLSVQSRLVSNPSLVSTGKLALGNQPADSTQAPNLTYDILSGDNSVIQQLAALSTSLTSFSATKGLAASNTTFSQYAGQIIATTSTNSTTATATATNSQTLLSGYTTAAQQVSGVNLDQQLANTVIYQNSYSASARIITVVSQMFDTLIQSIQ